MTHYSSFEVFLFFNVRPGPVTTLLTLIYPFNGQVWLLTLCGILLALPAIFLINIKTPVTPFHCVQIVISSIVSDSMSPGIMRKLHKNWYGSIVLTIWFLGGFLLLSAYSSNLLASLMVVKKSKPDDTFEVS